MITKKLPLFFVSSLCVAFASMATADAAHVTSSRALHPSTAPQCWSGSHLVSQVQYTNSSRPTPRGSLQAAIQSMQSAALNRANHPQHSLSVVVPHAPNTNIIRKRTTSSGDYLAQVGGSTRWPLGKNIKVYVASAGGRASYRSMISASMNKWAAASGGAFTWEFTNNQASADYAMTWTSTQREVAAGTEAGLTTTDTVLDEGREIIQHAQTRVLTRYDGEQLDDFDVAETILHEIGHGLGLEGHSSNPHDIMFYAAAKGQNGLTARDTNTIAKLYSN